MADLITLSDLNKFLGTTTASTAEIMRRKALISQVSAAVEQWCDRTFTAATYRQWYDGTGSIYLKLDQWPVTRLYQVANGTQDMGRLSYSGSSPEAFASSDGATLTLVAGDTATDLTLSSYASVTLLKTAIENVTGWSFAITTGADSYVPTKMRPFSGYVEASGDVIDIEMPDEAIDARIADRSEWLIEGSFPCGKSNIFVWYKAGYATIPDDLKLAVTRIVADMDKVSERDATLKGEKLGDYSYTAGGAADGVSLQDVVSNYSGMLSHYKRVEFA